MRWDVLRKLGKRSGIGWVLAVVGLVGSGGCGGNGVIRSPDDNSSFEDLLSRAAQQKPATAFSSEGDARPGTPTTGDDAGGAVTERQETPEVSIATESRCHPGDLDAMNEAMADMFGQAQIDGLAYDLTLETEDLRVLGHVKLTAQQLITPEQKKRVHVLNELKQALPIRIPADLVAKKEIKVSLFACVDSDKDGSCADEKANDITGTPANGQLGAMANVGDVLNMPFRTNLAAQIPLIMTIEDKGVSFKSMNPSQGSASDPFNLASVQMGDLLRNLNRSDVGLEDQPLSVTLSVRASDDPMCETTPRDSGCFVAGTRILVGRDRWVPVEKLGVDSDVLTSDGRKVRSLRAVAGPEKEKVFAIKVEGGRSVTVTSLHPMMTARGLRIARDLTADDKILDQKGEPVAIESIERKAYTGQVYNFALPGVAQGDHLIVAEGLVTGDLFLQEKLSTAAKFVAKK